MRKDQKKNPEKVMTLIEHLEELRRRIIICLIAFIFTSIISYFTSSYIFILLSHPLKEKLVFLGPFDAFFVYLKITLLFGFILALPVIFYQIWVFISPGLTSKERRYALPFVITATLLFCLGAGFGFFTFPLGLKFFLKFAGDVLKPMLTVDKYISFVLSIILAFGILFEFPLVVVFLTKIGVASSSVLKRNRKYALLGIVALAAIITPTQDIFTLIFISLPLILFYEIGIFLTKFIK